MVFLNNLRLKSKDPQTRRKAIESLDLEREDPHTFQVLTTQRSVAGSARQRG
jgi:hypothetical protein